MNVVLHPKSDRARKHLGILNVTTETRRIHWYKGDSTKESATYYPLIEPEFRSEFAVAVLKEDDPDWIVLPIR